LTGPQLALIGLVTIAALFCVEARLCRPLVPLSLKNPSSAKAFHDVKPAHSRGANAA